jgi:predicted ArsR family transcriptional regulator
LQLADHIFDSPVITIPQAEEALGVTYHTAQRHVQRLIDADILHQAGDADYGRTFVAGEILDVIAADSD